MQARLIDDQDNLGVIQRMAEAIEATIEEMEEIFEGSEMQEAMEVDELHKRYQGLLMMDALDHAMIASKQLLFPM